MPVIREYNRRFSEGLGPQQERQRTADDFGAAEGRALTQLGQGVQKAGDALYKRAEQQELSDLNAKLSKVQADNSLELQDLIRTAQPGDRKVFEEFNKKAEERVKKVGEDLSTISGRNYFDQASSKIKNNLRVSTARTQAELDGEKAVLDYTDSVNNLSAGLVSDPSSLEISMDLHNQGIDNLVSQGLLPASEAAKLKQRGEKDLVKSSIRGWAKLNPEYAKDKLKAGEYDKILGGDAKVQMFGEIDQAIRAKEIEAERQKRRQKEILQEQQLNTQNKFLKEMTDGKLSTDQILNSNLEAFGSGSKEQFLRMLRTVNEKGGRLKTNPNTFIALFDRINLPEGDPKKINSEAELNDYLGNGLDYGDLNKLRQEMAGTKTEKGRIENSFRKQLFDIAKGQLTKSNPLVGVADPQGDENLLLFQQFAYEQMEEHKKAGKPLKDLFDPTSKDYLGKYIQNYKRTPQEIMRAQMQQLQATQPSTLTDSLNDTNPQPPGQKAKPARNPGESISSYLERIKQGGGN